MVGLPADGDDLFAKYRISQDVEENDKSVKLPANAI